MQAKSITRREDAEAPLRALGAGERELYAAHLRRLSPRDRMKRFAHAISSHAIDLHADAVFDRGDLVIGWFEGQALAGSCELCALRDEPFGAGLEASFAVERSARGCGVGRALMSEALRLARALGAAKLRIETEPNNAAMIALAERFGAQIWLGDDEVIGILDTEEPERAGPNPAQAASDFLTYGAPERGRQPPG